MSNRFLIVAFIGLFMSACVSMIYSGEQPLRHEAAAKADYDALARCVVRRLNADSRPFMQLYHYKSRLYPDIHTAEIYAYDTRFLPYIHSSNSPQNPDAVRDYIQTSPEIVPDVQQVIAAEYAYAFVLTIKKTDDAASVATVKGNNYVSGIAWHHLQACEAQESSR